VARGDVEIGFNQISEIVAASGVDLLGRYRLQYNTTLFSPQEIVASSTNQEAVKALLAFVASPAATAIMHTGGFETP